jgi:hypothetical protein
MLLEASHGESVAAAPALALTVTLLEVETKASAAGRPAGPAERAARLCRRSRVCFAARRAGAYAAAPQQHGRRLRRHEEALRQSHARSRVACGRPRRWRRAVRQLGVVWHVREGL